MPETVVITDYQSLYLIVLLQGSHKLLCRKTSQVKRKIKHDAVIHTCTGKQGNFLIASSEQLGMKTGLHDLAGMYGKGNDRRSKSTCSRSLAHLFYQKPMSPMHSVKKADGGYTGQEFFAGYSGT